MAMADLFFPGNPGRREELASLRAKLNELIDKCCKGTNKLIEMIEKHFPERTFSKINVDASKDIRYNCDLIVDRIKEIQDYLEIKNLEVEQYLGTELFQNLVSINTSFEVTIARAKNWMLLSRFSLGLGAIVLPILIKKTSICHVLPKSLKLISGFKIAGAIAAVAVVIEVVGSVIIGAKEKCSLEEAIQDFKKAIAKLEPGAEAFYDNICMVRAKLECLPK